MVKCKNPFMYKEKYPMPCGRCAACRASNGRIWSLRLILESLLYSDASFVTLTYDENNLPTDYLLKPAHLQGYLKRLRHRVNFKYFACGEYGDSFGRPHYHIILFGVRFDNPAIKDCWKFGFVCSVANTIEAMKYTCGYVLKKINMKVKQEVSPPFLRCSKGLGWRFLDLHNVPFTSFLQVGNKKYFVGRYLRNKLANKHGVLEIVKDEGLKKIIESFNLECPCPEWDLEGRWKWYKSVALPYVRNLEQFFKLQQFRRLT